MIGALVRRLLCRAGHHDVLRCAGREDHRWRHDGTRWVATLDRVPPTTPVRPQRGNGYPATGPTLTGMPTAPSGSAPGEPRHRSTP